jgi:hypothetical protein
VKMLATVEVRGCLPVEVLSVVIVEPFNGGV